MNPLGLVRLEVDGGLRTQQLLPATSNTTFVPAVSLTNTRWIGASVDLSLGRSWYLLASGSRDGSGVELTNQAYASVVFRF